MAKRNKAKFASKGRKSALRVEALEQRQLLAAVTGGGTEVGSNIVHPNGNVYDQVLMTGGSVTVTADAGQVTRVSFLDLSGDIVQAEFGGKGTLTITLDQFTGAAPAANYNQPGVNYVKGLATFTIQGEDANTNFSVFSVGAGNAVNSNLFAGGKTGGNNYADVAALRIVNDPTNPGGFSAFGGVRAGNAIFASDSGVVGIAAAGVNVQGPVIIGDVDASASGVPTLNFGGGSQFGTLTVSGGDLAQSNGAAIANAGFTSINSTAGTTSAGTNVPSKVVPATTTFTGTAPTVTTLDTLTSVDITGKTQAELDAIFLGRTFTNAVTITGDVGVAQAVNVAEFKGGVTFKGDMLGSVVSTRGIASLTAEKALGGAVTVGTAAAPASLGNVTVGAGLSATVNAANIGNVTVTGNFSGGALTTDVDNDDAAEASGNLEGKIGNVSVSGNMSGSAAIEGVLGIGNISIGGNVTSDGANAGGGGLFVTRSSGAGSGDRFIANIGTVAVGGDIDQGGTGGNVINIAGNGVWGNVTVNGTGSSSGATQIGKFTQGGTTLGSSTTKTGTITINETASDVTWGGLTVAATSGIVGAVSITGAGTTSADFTQAAAVSYTGISGDGISIGGFLTMNLATGYTARSTPVTLTTIAGNATNAATVSVAGTWGTLAVDLGAITINAGTANSSVTFTGDILADDFSSVTITAASTDMTAGFGLSNDESVGAITINGNASLTGTSLALGKAIASITVTGTTALGAGVVIGNAGGNLTGALTLNNTTFANGAQVLIKGDVGSIVLNGTTTMTANTGSSFVLDNDASATDDLGSLTINGKVLGSATAGVNDLVASSIGNVTITGSLAQDEVLVNDLSILAAPNGDAVASNAETVVVDGSNLANYGIGNISITTDLALAFTGTSIFKGDNTFAALGKIGDIAITGDTAGAQQSKIFSAATDAAWFAAGDVDGLYNATNALGTNVPRDTAGAVVALDYTGGTVTVGNISVNALQTSTATGYSAVDGINGTDADAGGTIEGFAVLSGVKNMADGDLINLDAAGMSTTSATAIDADLKGTIGSILIASNNAVGFLDPLAGSYGTTLAGTAGDQIGAIIAKTSVGNMQSVANSSSSTSGFGAIIGDVNATADDTVEDAEASNQVVVIVL